MTINRTASKAFVIQIIGEGVTPPFDGQNFTMKPEQWEEVKKVIDEYYESGEWYFDNLKAQAKLEEEIRLNERMSGHKIKTQSQKDFVYFVSAPGQGIKIGFTTNLKNRMKSLQTASPHKLELIGQLDNVEQTEEIIAHKAFSEYRLEGEWFDISQGDVSDYIYDFERGESNG